LLVVPVKDKKNNTEISKIEAGYSERLASKNAEVSNLTQENQTLQKTIDEYKKRESEKDKKISGLEESVGKLKEQLEEANLKLPDEKATDTDASKESGSDTKGTNGISDEDVDNMITNE
ncbi:MAG: hypothetical protein IJJ89_04010, partial [Eubacterium sp.]|nr:hypothetical protein [Eubacterium sp.]